MPDAPDTVEASPFLLLIDDTPVVLDSRVAEGFGVDSGEASEDMPGRVEA